MHAFNEVHTLRIKWSGMDEELENTCINIRCKTCTVLGFFYVHVTVHRNKFLYHEWNILVLLESCLQTCMTYTSA